MDGGYIACSSIASAGAVVETDNDTDTLWEGGQTWCPWFLPWTYSSSPWRWSSRWLTGASSP